ncbi:heterokaryon incompatibility protein-domain-containing protein, partial [Massariosphaeria phaeospora]
MKEILDGPGIPSILPRTSASSWFKPLTSRVDFDVPKRWLQLCSSLHKCHRLIEEVGPSRLIDCNARVIIPTGQTANSAYVTLSYVWGSSAKDDTASIPALETTSWILPEELPKTIEDAITVTQELGYRYLWVDKYCIDQSRSEDFISQVQQMDLIYRNSVLTIIDAAGHDPFKGLPGVRPDSRSPIQPSVSVGDYELYSTMHRPEWDIKTSRWSTRAWTYQEGLLSRRRLIFTAQQMYFECQGVYCKEALDFPTDGLQELHLDSPKKGHSLHEDFRRANGMGVFPFRLIGANVWEIYARMTEYSGRSLTRDDDILNGILGLFRYTGRTRYPIINLWGLPYRL